MYEPKDSLLKRYLNYGVCYAVCLGLSRFTLLDPEAIPAVAFDTGFLLGVYLIEGPRLIPLLLIGEVLAHWLGLRAAFAETSLELQVTLYLTTMLGLLAQLVLTEKWLRTKKLYATPLETPRQITGFILYSSLSFTWIVPLIFTLVLKFLDYKHGTTQFHVLPFLGICWLSQILGVMLLTPLVHSFMHTRLSQSFRNKLIVFIFINSVITFFIHHQTTNQKLMAQSELRDDSANYVQLLKQRLFEAETTLKAIQGFFIGSQSVTRQEFRDFIAHAFPNHPLIKSFEWAPQITQAERAEFEKSVRTKFSPNFQIIEFSEGKRVTRANTQEAYFPVNFLVPYGGNERVHGFDLASSPERFAAMKKAWSTGKITATEYLALIEGQTGFLMMAPIYRKVLPANMPMRSQKALSGFAIIAIDLANLLQNQANISKQHLIIHLFDITRSPAQFVYHNVSNHPKWSTFRHSRDIEVGQRQWQLIFQPTTAFLAVWIYHAHFLLLISSILITLLGTLFSLIALSQNDVVTRQVTYKTQEIRSSINLLKLFIKHTPAAVAMFDQRMRYLMVSQKWCEVYAKSEDALIDSNHYEVFPELSQDEFMVKAYREALAGKASIVDEHLWHDPTGRARWLKWSIHPWRNTEGVIGGIITFTEDITEAKSETAYKLLQNEITRLIAENRPINDTLSLTLQLLCKQFHWDVGVTWAIDKSRQVLTSVQAWTRLGDGAPAFFNACRENPVTREEALLGHTWVSQTPTWIEQLDAAVPFSRKAAARTSGFQSAFAFPIGVEDETLLIIECYSRIKQPTNPSLLKATQSLGMQLGQFLKKREAESKLKESELYKSLILNSIYEGIFTFDREFKLLSFNRRFADIFQLNPQKAPPTLRTLLPQLDDTFINTSLPSTFEVCLIHLPQRFIGEITVSQMPTSQKGACFVGMLRDISSRKEVDRQKNEFVSNVSHEIRTPLTSIKGSLALLTSGKLGKVPKRMEELLSLAQKNCERLIRMVNTMLDIEKLETGKMPLRLESVDLNQLIVESIELNEAYSSSFGVTIDFAPSLSPCEVITDPDKLIQVMTNLLSNAAKFSPAGGTITLRLDFNETHATVSVADRGPGITPEFAPHVFEKFSQSDTSTTRSHQGSGLGLCISKAFIEAMHGRIGFEPNPAGGTVFYFSLPRRQGRSCRS